jgi:DNA-binding transcriptional regulator YhcF (GntR family)
MSGHKLLEKWNLLQAILAHPDLNANAKVIAAKLLDHLNSKTGLCFPSYRTLAKGTKLSRRVAMNAVKLLETKGILKVNRLRKPGVRARSQSNEYYFDWSMTWTSRQAKPTTQRKHSSRSANLSSRPSGVSGTTLDADQDLVPMSRLRYDYIRQALVKTLSVRPETS